MEAKERWYYEHLRDVHNRNLDMIKSQSGGRIDNSPPATMQLNKNRVNSYLFLKNQGLQNIYKKNQVILLALKEISKQHSKKMQGKLQSSQSQGPKTLNFYLRKREFQKILDENDFILNKITNKEATLSVRKFDEEFRMSRKYKKNLAKKFFMDSQKKLDKKIKLPNLDSNSEQDQKKSQKPKKIMAKTSRNYKANEDGDDSLREFRDEVKERLKNNTNELKSEVDRQHDLKKSEDKVGDDSKVEEENKKQLIISKQPSITTMEVVGEKLKGDDVRKETKEGKGEVKVKEAPRKIKAENGKGNGKKEIEVKLKTGKVQGKLSPKPESLIKSSENAILAAIEAKSSQKKPPESNAPIIVEKSSESVSLNYSESFKQPANKEEAVLPVTKEPIKQEGTLSGFIIIPGNIPQQPYKEEKKDTSKSESVKSNSKSDHSDKKSSSSSSSSSNTPELSKEKSLKASMNSPKPVITNFTTKKSIEPIKNPGSLPVKLPIKK